MLLNSASASLSHGGVVLLENPSDLPTGRGLPPLQFRPTSGHRPTIATMLHFSPLLRTASQPQTLQCHCESSARTAATLPSEPSVIRMRAVFSCHIFAARPAPAIGRTLPVPHTAANSSPIHKR